MQGADLEGLRLQGADLTDARLEGADLSAAELQNAALFDAKLQGALLGHAQLQGAVLVLAQLQGAFLDNAQLQGAYLDSANLKGASLKGTHLQGASLKGAGLQGADLSSAELQGSSLAGSKLADSYFNGSLVFRTDVSNADLLTSVVRSVQADQVKLRINVGKFSWEGATADEPLTQDDVDKWIDAATEFGPEIERAMRTDQFARLKSNFQTPEVDAADSSKWRELEQKSQADDPTGVYHRSRMATILGDLACGADGGPYVARNLVSLPVNGWLARPFSKSDSRLATLGDQLDGVRERMNAARKNPESCPGVVGFTKDDWRGLEAIEPVRD